MTRPRRRMTLHFSQILRTDALTFMPLSAGLQILHYTNYFGNTARKFMRLTLARFYLHLLFTQSVCDSPFRQVVGGQLYFDAIAG